jgi:glutamine synthetase
LIRADRLAAYLPPRFAELFVDLKRAEAMDLLEQPAPREFDFYL